MVSRGCVISGASCFFLSFLPWDVARFGDLPTFCCCCWPSPFFYSSGWCVCFFRRLPAMASFGSTCYFGYLLLAFSSSSFFLSVRPTGDRGDVCLWPLESWSDNATDPCTEPPDAPPLLPKPLRPLFKSPKSSEPFFEDISVCANFGLNNSL